MLSAAGEPALVPGRLCAGYRSLTHWSPLGLVTGRSAPGSFSCPILGRAQPTSRPAGSRRLCRADPGPRPAAHMTRAVLEGVAFGLRDSLESMIAAGVQGLRGTRPGRRASSRLWRQILADVLRGGNGDRQHDGKERRTARRCSRGSESAGTQQSRRPSRRRCVPRDCRVAGRSRSATGLGRRPTRPYRDLYPALAPSFRRLSRLTPRAARGPCGRTRATRSPRELRRPLPDRSGRTRFGSSFRVSVLQALARAARAWRDAARPRDRRAMVRMRSSAAPKQRGVVAEGGRARRGPGGAEAPRARRRSSSGLRRVRLDGTGRLAARRPPSTTRPWVEDVDERPASPRPSQRPVSAERGERDRIAGAGRSEDRVYGFATAFRRPAGHGAGARSSRPRSPSIRSSRSDTSAPAGLTGMWADLAAITGRRRSADEPSIDQAAPDADLRPRCTGRRRSRRPPRADAQRGRRDRPSLAIESARRDGAGQRPSRSPRGTSRQPRFGAIETRPSLRRTTPTTATPTPIRGLAGGRRCRTLGRERDESGHDLIHGCMGAVGLLAPTDPVEGRRRRGPPSRPRTNRLAMSTARDDGPAGLEPTRGRRPSPASRARSNGRLGDQAGDDELADEAADGAARQARTARPARNVTGDRLAWNSRTIAPEVRPADRFAALPRLVATDRHVICVPLFPKAVTAGTGHGRHRQASGATRR